MAIKTIDVQNVMVFHDSGAGTFHLSFCDGINVLIGENGVGKTTILKMIYVAAQESFERNGAGKKAGLLDFFSNNLKNSETLKNSQSTERDICGYKVSDGAHIFENRFSEKEEMHYKKWIGLNIPSVFIPTTEMLSHAKGFLAMNQKYNMPFDGTQIDIIMNASLPETREIPESCKMILDEISQVIDGTVIQEEDTFYVLKKDGHKVDFSLEAEGLRKLGLLWKLIRNGLLEKESVLLWDEPEANLNPELYPLVVNILLRLEKMGVQIFLATHSYNFAKYLEIRRETEKQVLFHNLYKEKEICSSSAYKMGDLEPNHIMIADNKLLDEVYDM